MCAELTATLTILVGSIGRVAYLGALELVAGVSLALGHHLARAVDLAAIDRVA